MIKMPQCHVKIPKDVALNKNYKGRPSKRRQNRISEDVS